MRGLWSLLKKGTVPFQRMSFPRQIGIAERDCPLFQRTTSALERLFCLAAIDEHGEKSGDQDGGNLAGYEPAGIAVEQLGQRRTAVTKHAGHERKNRDDEQDARKSRQREERITPMSGFGHELDDERWRKGRQAPPSDRFLTCPVAYQRFPRKRAFGAQAGHLRTKRAQSCDVRRAILAHSPCIPSAFACQKCDDTTRKFPRWRERKFCPCWRLRACRHVKEIKWHRWGDFWTVAAR